MVHKRLSAAMVVLWLISPVASSQPPSSNDSDMPYYIFANVTVNGADNDMVDFGFYIKGTIGDLVWSDSDGDGIYDVGDERGLPGVSVSLYDAKSGACRCITSTNESGNYTFEVDYGIYRVIVAEDEYADFEPIYNKYYIKLPEFVEVISRWLPTTDNEYVVVIDKDNLKNTSIDFGLGPIE